MSQVPLCPFGIRLVVKTVQMERPEMMFCKKNNEVCSVLKKSSGCANQHNKWSSWQVSLDFLISEALQKDLPTCAGG